MSYIHLSTSAAACQIKGIDVIRTCEFVGREEIEEDLRARDQLLSIDEGEHLQSLCLLSLETQL